MRLTKKTCILLATAAIGLASCAAPNDPYRTSEPTYPTYPAQDIARYGYVESIETVAGESRRESPGIGAIGGAVAGGVLGNQIGHGTGRAAATVGGAVIGGVVGHQVEQRVRGNQAGTDYLVRVRMDDGTYQTFRQDTASSVRVGDRVRVEAGTLYAM
jgi:outer membrane lipoprotein SlyB